jgi:putative transposase
VVFFSFVIDVFSRRVVGWQFAGNMRTDLVLDAAADGAHPPQRRRRRRPRPSLRLRQPYTSYAFTQVLDDHAVLASIGSVGDAYDNALVESFVESFKTELIRDRVWRTRTQLELAIVEDVGRFNSTRLHQALGDRPPAEMEALYAARTVLTPSLNQ